MLLSKSNISTLTLIAVTIFALPRRDNQSQFQLRADSNALVPRKAAIVVTPSNYQDLEVSHVASILGGDQAADGSLGGSSFGDISLAGIPIPPAPVSGGTRVCTPRDTVRNPSFELRDYPFLFWNLSNSNGVYAYNGAGYGVDGNGPHSSPSMSYGGDAGWAAAGVGFAPQSPSIHTGQEFTLHQDVEVCPGATYKFMVYARILVYSGDSTDSYIELSLGRRKIEYLFSQIANGQLNSWSPIQSPIHTAALNESHVPLMIKVHAGPAAFGGVYGPWDYKNGVEVNLDIVKLIPLPNPRLSNFTQEHLYG